MATYIALVSFTDQGIRNIKATVERSEVLKAMAERAGAKVKAVYWTLGQYDIVDIFEVPDDKTAMALLFALGSLGNVRTQTLRAFSSEEIKEVLGTMP